MFKRKDPAKLQQQLSDLKGGKTFESSSKDEWKLKVDSAGNGSAVIRFLPSRDEDSAPFIKLINHGFKLKTGGGPWYISNCSSTHGDFDSCPVCKYISENDLYNNDKDLYQLLKRKTSFWANILVIKDSETPENEGKIFKFRFGQKIMDKINQMVEVDVEIGEVPVDVTCPFEGANFSLKTKKVSGFQNYDDSKFLKQTELTQFGDLEDEDTAKAFVEKLFDLQKIVAPEEFKSFEENEKMFNKSMGKSVTSTKSAVEKADNFEREIDNLHNEIDETESALDKMGSTKSSSKGDDDLDDLLNDLDLD